VFEAARRARGWSLADAARAAGYKNIDKGMRRLRRIESGDPFPRQEVLERFAAALVPQPTWIEG
jgi:transcriptional regulator with XRE-family HTH domain